jgi:hypothetical protein
VFGIAGLVGYLRASRPQAISCRSDEVRRDYSAAIILDSPAASSDEPARPLPWGRQAGRMRGGETARLRLVLIILGVILVVAAVAGGIAVHYLLWLLLILALVVFAIGALTGRITE